MMPEKTIALSKSEIVLAAEALFQYGTHHNSDQVKAQTIALRERFDMLHEPLPVPRMKRLFFALGQGYTADGRPIQHSDLILERIDAEKHIVETFGGMTSVNMIGAWRTPAAHIVNETSWGIEVYTDSHHAVKAIEIATWLKTEFMQEKVLLVVQDVDSITLV